MSSNNTAQQGNAISQASLDESRRQYNEQEAEKKRKKEAAQANALSVRQAGTMAYQGSEFASTNLSMGGVNYSLLNTEPAVNGLVSDLGYSDKLGG